jgi:hypothetical protein
MKWYRHVLYNDDDDVELLEYLNKLLNEGVKSEDVKINFGSNYTIIYYYSIIEVKS